jgi:ParB/RepB/Spo0J family partition protein
MTSESINTVAGFPSVLTMGGQYALVKVGSVKTTRLLSDGKRRFREPDAKKVAARVASMKVYGQLQPILIEEDGELVDGEYRLLAARQLKWDTIAAVVRDKMDDLTARTLELEANIQREDMTWQERAYALAELHKLRSDENPDWSQDVTAEEAGVAQPRVAEALMITKMAELFPEIKEAKSMNQALSWAKAKAAQVVRVREVKDAPELYATIEERIILGDSTEVIKSIPDETFNLILTDPPFGIDYDRRKEGTESSLSTYKDDEENYIRLLGMAPDLYRVIKKDGWLVWFFGMSWYERAKLAFRAAGFIVDELPIVWDRSDGRTFTTRPDRYFGRGYDVALHCIKGSPQVIEKYRSASNIIKVPPVAVNDRDLTVERPVELYQELIRRLTVPNEYVADFFVGSGSCPAAAASLDRRYYGCELDPERRAVAIKKIAAWTGEER